MDKQILAQRGPCNIQQKVEIILNVPEQLKDYKRENSINFCFTKNIFIILFGKDTIWKQEIK